MKPTKDDVARQFGRHAHAYATSPTHAGGGDLAILIGLLDLEPGMVALDVATGAGHTALALAPRVRQVVAADLTPEMLEEVRALARERGLTNVETCLADAEDLPFPDAAFDLVTCRIAPHHFLDIERAVAELARVLRPGGQIGLEDSVSPDDPDLDRFVNGIEKLRDPTHVRSYTEAEWRAMLQGAGLEVRQAELYRKQLEIAPWIERSGMDAGGAEQVYAAFSSADPAARRHFVIECEDGRAVSFTLDQLILRADSAVA